MTGHNNAGRDRPVFGDGQQGGTRHSSALNTMMLAATGWARPPLAVNVEAVFERLESAAPVQLIATPRDALVTCEAEDNLRALLDDPDKRPFDDLPVRRNGRVVGLLPRAALEREMAEVAAGVMVADAMRALDETMLMAAEAPLLTYLAEASTYPTRLVVDGATISGVNRHRILTPDLD